LAIGNTADRSTNVAGRFRYNTDSARHEFNTGSGWFIYATAQQLRDMFAAYVPTVQSESSVLGNGTVGNKLRLDGDVASPGASKYWGTNASGVKGFFNLPSGGGGGFSPPAPRHVSGNATFTTSDLTLLVSSSEGDCTVTINHNTYGTIKKSSTDSNTITIVAVSGTIDGLASITLELPYEGVSFHSDGTNIYLIPVN
jgi:hypothetical protein